MRFWLIAALLLWPPSCLGSQNASDATTYRSPMWALDNVPDCAKKCLMTVVSESTCQLDDMKCICQDEALQTDAAACVTTSCTQIESLETKNITSIACDWRIRDKSSQYSTMAIALGITTVCLVLARLTFKSFFSATRTLGRDDKVIFGTLALRVACTVINVEGLARHGLGRDVWTQVPNELALFAEFLYIMEVLYLTELPLIKISLALFYIYIFPGKTVQRILWGTVAFNAICGLIFAIIAIFPCVPVNYFWVRYLDGSSSGKCIDNNAFAWANAAISIVVDIWMIAIPLSQITKLQLHWKKKTGVVVMFLLGAFVNIVSILRLRALISFANSSNPTWDQYDTVYWSTIEVNVGMICTCLPSLRLILLRIFPKLIGNGSASYKSFSADEPKSRTHQRSQVFTNDHQLSDIERCKNGIYLDLRRPAGES